MFERVPNMPMGTIYEESSPEFGLKPLIWKVGGPFVIYLIINKYFLNYLIIFNTRTNK